VLIFTADTVGSGGGPVSFFLQEPDAKARPDKRSSAKIVLLKRSISNIFYLKEKNRAAKKLTAAVFNQN
jgi:hypothetical protein